MMIITLSVMLFSSFNASAEVNYTGSSYAEVRDHVFATPYRLPQNKINFLKLTKWFESKIYSAANRTLNDRSDLLPYFDKLAHPNGICLAGTWNITEENPYGGYFKKDTQSLIIARASTALNETKSPYLRGFGMAGKIFPTMLENEKVKTASFFLVDDLGGTRAMHYTDVELTNTPNVSVTTGVLSKMAYAITVGLTFTGVDKNPTVRQLYEISELGESNPQNVMTPKYMMIKAAIGQTINERDFRDELNIRNFNHELVFDIYVASKLLGFFSRDLSHNMRRKKDYKKIGTINFTRSVVSSSCDHNLHFPHPKWRSDLNHL